jgi:hypothetical protein
MAREVPPGTDWGHDPADLVERSTRAFEGFADLVESRLRRRPAAGLQPVADATNDYSSESNRSPSSAEPAAVVIETVEAPEAPVPSAESPRRDDG